MTRAARKAHKAHARRRGVYVMKYTDNVCVANSVRQSAAAVREQKKTDFYNRIHTRQKKG